LFADKDWFYPIIDGVPRLLIESFLDHEEFLKANLSDYENRKEYLLKIYSEIIQQAVKKNKRTKKSFELNGVFLIMKRTKHGNSKEMIC
jgi:hypothetical protein